MSLDGKDSGAVWQDPNEGKPKRPFHQSQPIDQGSQADFIDAELLPPLPDQDNEETTVLHRSAFSRPGSETGNEPDDAPPDKPELWGQAWHYLSLVLAPLLFGGLTCLFVLPLIATGHAKLPPEGMWPIALIIIAIAVGQGIAMYYAGSNNGLWAVATIGAFFLYLIVGCFAIFGAVSGFFLTALLIVATIVLARLYVRSIPEGYVTIIYAFGKYARTLYSGFNILLPWEKVGPRLHVAETEWVSPIQRIQMSREEDVVLRATISFQLMPEDAYLAVTQVKDWEESLHEVFLTAIQSIATMFSPEDLLVWQRGLRAQATRTGQPASSNTAGENGMRWEKINSYLYQRVRDRVALWGIQVNWVHVRDITLTPHSAPIMDATDPVMRPRPVDTGATRGAPPAASQPQQVRMTPKQEAAASPKIEPAKAPIPSIIKEEDLEKILAKAYKAVQDGKITDPDTIRDIARQFASIANDPEKSKLVSFDAERAARNLQMRADANEVAFNSNTIYNDETKTDWNMHRHTDENMMAGG